LEYIKTQVSTARQLVQIIDALDPKEIREPVRKYAKDVLKYDLPD